MNVSLLVVVGIVSIALAGGALPTASPDPIPTVPPPNETDHGVNESTFTLLWSDDIDASNLTLDAIGNTTTEVAWLSALARSTDVTFAAPPPAVSIWNAGEHAEFAADGVEATIAPANVSLRTRGLVQDAYVHVFAVEPSTVVHFHNHTGLFVAPEGRIHVVLDYRVLIPPPVSNGQRRVLWELIDHRIENVTASANGQSLGTAQGTHAPTFSYSDLQTVTANDSVRFHVQGTITARLREAVQTCRIVETEDGPEGWNQTLGECEGEWVPSSTIHNHSVVVTDTRQVTVNILGPPNGSRATFARTGSHGLLVNTAGLWSRAGFGQGDAIQSSWRFYVASTPAWRTVHRHTTEETTTNASTIRPLQVHAVPVRRYPRVDPNTNLSWSADFELARTWGSMEPGPSLPQPIDVATADRYQSASSLEIHTSTRSLSYFDDVTLTGLVRGVSRTGTVRKNVTTVYDVQIESAVETVDADTVRLRLRPVTVATGAPVLQGRLHVVGRVYDVSPSGQEITTLVSRAHRTAIVEYRPPPWWETTTDVGYRPTTARVLVPSPTPGFATVVDVAVVTVLWVLPLALVLYAFVLLRRRTAFSWGR